MQINNKIKALFALVVILASTVLVSVTPRAVTAGIQKGGSLTVDLVAEPTNLNPLTGAWNTGFVTAQIYESLLTFSQNLSLMPNLATSWSVNSQDGTYTFNLRKGVTWQDGVPFTSQDVKFTFENIISKYDIFGSAYFANTTVSTPDNYTAVIKPGKFLPGVQMILFASLDGAIFPEHILKGQNYLQSTLVTSSPVGTGPFKLAQWVKGQYMVLQRNPNYWDQPKPYLDNITIKFISDPTALVAGLQRGEIDYVFRGLPFTSLSSLNQTSSLKVVPYTRPPYVSAIWFNLKAPYVSDIRVRQAIAYALNRTDIALKATYGYSKPVQYMIDPSVVPPSPNLTIYNYDLNKANQLLDSAGYARGPDGTRFTLELLTRTGAPDEAIWAQLVKDQLAKIGIAVNIKTVDFATYLSLESKFNYQMATTSYWISPIWTYQLFDSAWIGKGPFTNNFQYNSSRVDSLFNQWLSAVDPQQQVKILQQVEDQISADLPEIVLYQDVWPNVVNKNFAGPDIPVGKYVFWDELKNTYYLPAQSVTTPQTSQQSSNTLLYAVAAVVVLVVLVFVALRLRPRRKTQTNEPPAG